MSLSSRRAWIEISHIITIIFDVNKSLSSRRAWIEIHLSWLTPHRCLSRSPHGERGLKSRHHNNIALLRQSLSSRRAWIEIADIVDGICTIKLVALLTESVDWNVGNGIGARNGILLSLSSRRAWIEIAQLLSLPWHQTCRSPHGERGLKFVYSTFSPG